jgi:hypothetical protein
VELCTEADREHAKVDTHLGQRARLSGAGRSLPVSIREISASTSEADDEEARRLLGPG